MLCLLFVWCDGGCGVYCFLKRARWWRCGFERGFFCISGLSAACLPSCLLRQHQQFYVFLYMRVNGGGGGGGAFCDYYSVNTRFVYTYTQHILAYGPSEKQHIDHICNWRELVGLSYGGYYSSALIPGALPE